MLETNDVIQKEETKRSIPQIGSPAKKTKLNVIRLFFLFTPIYFITTSFFQIRFHKSIFYHIYISKFDSISIVLSYLFANQIHKSRSKYKDLYSPLTVCCQHSRAITFPTHSTNKIGPCFFICFIRFRTAESMPCCRFRNRLQKLPGSFNHKLYALVSYQEN